MTVQSLAGSSAIHVAGSELDDNVQHHISTRMGKPTTKLGDTDVSTYQALPHSNRYYSNNLGARNGRTGSSALRNRTGSSALRKTPPPIGPTNVPQTQQRQHAAVATVAAVCPPVARDPSIQFEKRVVQATLADDKFDPDSMRRKKRVIGDLSKESGDGNVTKMIVDSYVNDFESPEKGKSQEAFARALQYTKTPETNNERNDNDD